MTKIVDTSRYIYNSAFYQWTAESSRFSARQVIGLLAPYLKPSSVLDMGCGRGVWLSVWLEHGVPVAFGVDGDYVLDSCLLLPHTFFLPHDLCLPLDLGRTFDLVLSLEVAEHIPEASADVFLDSLCRHGRHILFSAARPGQGGENHLNEQLPDYWRNKFARRGYLLFDFLRPAIASIKGVSWWYKHNMFLYVAETEMDSLAKEIRDTLVPEHKSIEDNLPRVLRLRFAILSRLPRRVVTILARVNARLASI
jgi:SAM-dependent methyltransferase